MGGCKLVLLLGLFPCLKKYKKNGTFPLDLGNCTSSGEA